MKDNLMPRIVFKSDSLYSHSPEYLFLEIGAAKAKTLVGVVYRPPKAGNVGTVFEEIMAVAHSYVSVCFLGDWNIDMLSDSHDRSFLRNCLEMYNLTLLPLRPTHHSVFPPADTLIDHIIVNNIDSVIKFGQEVVPGLSRHELIYCCISASYEKYGKKKIVIRDRKKVDPENLIADFNAVNWDVVYSECDIDKKVHLFSENIKLLFEKHMPLKNNTNLEASCTVD